VIELGINMHSKIRVYPKSIKTGHPPYYPCSKPNNVGRVGCIKKNSSLTSTIDKTKIKYERQF